MEENCHVYFPSNALFGVPLTSTALNLSDITSKFST